MNKKYILFFLLLLFVLVIKISSGFDRSEYVKLIYTYNGFTEPYTIYEVCNPTNSNYYIDDLDKFNINFYGDKTYLEDWGIKLGLNKSEILPIYKKSCIPYVHWIYPNSSVIFKTNCDYDITGYYVKEKWEYVHYNMIGTSLSPKECRRIKVWGKMKPRTLNTGKVDNVIESFFRMNFTEHDWWNNSCNNRTSVVIEPVFSDDNQQLFLNISKDIDWNKAYVILNASNTELSFINITQESIWTNSSVINNTPLVIEIYHVCTASRFAYNYSEVMTRAFRFETQAEIDAFDGTPTGTWTLNTTDNFEGIGSIHSGTSGTEVIDRTVSIGNASIVFVAKWDNTNHDDDTRVVRIDSSTNDDVWQVGRRDLDVVNYGGYQALANVDYPRALPTVSTYESIEFMINSSGKITLFIGGQQLITLNGTYMNTTIIDNIRYHSNQATSKKYDIIYYYRNYDGNNANITIGEDEILLDVTSPNIIFQSQVPDDIDAFNIMSRNLSINYTIIDSSGVNSSNVTFFFKTNCTNRDISIFTNGTSLIGWQTINNISNISDIYTTVLDHHNIYPATFNFDDSLAEGYSHNPYDLDSSNEYIKVELFNVTNKKNSSFLIVYIDNQTALSNTARFYYCNSSYSTGNPVLSVDCTNFFNLEASQPYNHTHGNVFDTIIPFSVDVATGMIGGVYVTNTSQFLIRGRPINAWNVYYIDNISRIDAVQTTQDSGASWNNFGGTVRLYLHQFDGSDAFRSFICAEDIFGNSNCSIQRSDTLEPVPLPPTSPDVFKPNGSIVSGIMDINYTASLSSSGSRLLFYNISLLDAELNFFYLIRSNNSLNLSYRWNSSLVADGHYTVRVTVIDEIGFTSFGDSEQFDIDNINIAPNCTTIPDIYWLINNNQTLNLSLYCSDIENDTITYTILNVSHINVTVNQSIQILTFIPDVNFTGSVNYNFIYSDTYNNVTSNTFLLNISAPPIIIPLTVAEAIQNINSTVILIILIALFFIMLVFSEIYGGIYYLATSFIGIGVYMYLYRYVDMFISLPFLLFVMAVAIRMVFKWEKQKN